jgi:hypothetical protein
MMMAGRWGVDGGGGDGGGAAMGAGSVLEHQLEGRKQRCARQIPSNHRAEVIQVHASNGGTPATAAYQRDAQVHAQQLARCEGARDACALIDAHAPDFDHELTAAAFRKLLESRRDGVPRGDVQ